MKDAGKKILIASIVCAAIALLSWGFALIYSMTHRGGTGGKKITEEVAATSQTASSQNTNNVFYEHGLVETEDFTIKLTGYTVINPGEAGNEYESMPVIGFWYDVTNKSGREITAQNAWIYCIRAVQDNDENRVNELNMAIQPDSRYRDTQNEKIKQGGTVSSAVAYTLTDRTTPVTLIATDGILGEDLGERTFELQGASQAQPGQATQTTQTSQPAGQFQPGQTTQTTQTSQPAGQTQGSGNTGTTSPLPSLADPDTQAP